MEQRTTLKPDAVFGLLVDRRRRFVLHYLRMADDDVIELDPLIDWVTDRLADQHAPSEDRRARLEVALHHDHLPRLSEAGVLDYDWRSRTIRYVECDAVEAHLELVADEDLP